SEPCGSLCKIGGFFKKYKTEIITITVEVTVGVACGAVAVGAGAVTGGVGAVAVGASCGAIAGAAGAAVGNAMNSDADHSIAGYGTAIGKGALIGGISGAAGGALGNVAAKGIKAVGSKLISRTGKTGGAGGAKVGGGTAGAKAAAAKPVKPECFLAGTPVLLADGTTKNIEDIKVGDQVLATNPATGETSTQPVTELLPSEGDKELNKLTIATPDGNKNITATAEHPFWAPEENAWINAADLKPGTTLHTPNGTTARIIHNQPYTDHARTYNFSVAKLHTYYVLAGQTPVLVHNTCGDTPTHVTGKGDDPLVPELIEDINARYSGHVRAEGVTINGPDGSSLTDFDIVTRNAVVQVKSGSGKGALEQALNTQSLTDYPVIVYLPQGRGSVIKSLEKAGIMVTRDKGLLLDVLAP
ncbi:polymorphic toxin-type HINT domain-containing protein, partial [Streptomyces sp. NPDC093109]|uniref:polymorphic toxin-type HINT domain-containing protein n=1 Tax=Streptomyces sp. NPDC093109 TaxID=3154977 RepID=UPI00344EF07F